MAWCLIYHAVRLHQRNQEAEILPVSLSVKPLVDTQGTPTQVGTALTNSNLIRIKNGYIQKLLGCVAIGQWLYNDVMDVMTGWTPNDPTQRPLIAASSAPSTQVFQNGTVRDITSAALDGTGSVQALWGDWLLWTAIGQAIYYWIPSFPISGAGPLLPISGLSQQIAISSGTYNNGTGAVVLTMAVATSLAPGETFTLATLTGTGAFASLNGSWGATAGTGGVTVNFTAPSGLGATTITGGVLSSQNVPTAVNGIFVAAPQQQLFAWGVYSPTLGEQDPLLLAWSDVGDLGSWAPTTTNQAGSFRLSSGSYIVAGTWFGQVGLIWTDVDLWLVTYIGFPLVYSFNRIGQNCGLIALRAWGILGTTVAWMGHEDFYVYQGGSVQPIPCSVRDYAFNSLRRGLEAAIHCDPNSYGNEFMWRFIQLNNSKCTGYVKWSPAENNAWDIGEGAPFISCWDNTSIQYLLGELRGFGPVGTDYDENILQFETAFDWNGDALDSFYVTGWFYISEGQEQVFVERIMPDFNFNFEPDFASNPAGTMLMTFYFADEIPSSQTDYPVRTYGPYTVTETTPYLIIRGRGRVMQMRIDCTDGNTFYRNGKHMVRVSVDGRAF